MASRLSIKFLMNNTLAGCLIGSKGATIKELCEVTGAKVVVSAVNEVYPGTGERIISLAGTSDSVDSAQTLLWDMIGANARSGADRSVSWSPRLASETGGDADESQVTGKISIPASAGGLILGREGSNLRTIADESGATISMTGKDEAMFTQERILTITGSPASCGRSVSMILGKFVEDPDAAQYLNRGGRYTPHMGPMIGGGRGGGSDRGDRTRGRGRGDRGDSRGGGATAADSIVANTQITINVPDSLVGNILGKQGSTMREIMALSGAKVSVSPRDEMAEGTSNRVVTITGIPSCTQVAQTFIMQKLSQPSAPRAPRRSRDA